MFTTFLAVSVLTVLITGKLVASFSGTDREKVYTSPLDDSAWFREGMFMKPEFVSPRT